MKRIFAVLLTSLLLFFGCKTKTSCHVDPASKGSMEFDIDECACFIALKSFGKDYTLKQIKRALVLEEKFMEKVGLITEEPVAENDSLPKPVLDIEEMIQYALKNNPSGLTSDQLSNIYEVEIEYYQFIGLTEEE